MSIADKIKSVYQNIKIAAEQSGRNASDIRLIAVSKTKPVSMIQEAADAGMRDFGENKPQEIVEKFPQINVDGLRWHMIGHLQKNKVKYIIDKVYLIHSVDSSELAAEIEKRAASINKVQNILIQVNLSGEESKSGVKPEDAEELCREVSKLPHVAIKGFMTISGVGFSDEQNREVFCKLKSLANDIDRLGLDNVSTAELSMGMSGDYSEAVKSGSTMVRIGTGIFGKRDYSENKNDK